MLRDVSHERSHHLLRHRVLTDSHHDLRVLHERLMRSDSEISTVYAASEDQALTTATGLYVAGCNPVVLVQNQGLYKCTNTLRATCLDAGVPMVFLVGQFGREAENIGKPMTESRRTMVRLMEPFLDALGVAYWVLEADSDMGQVADAFTHAKKNQTAAVLLISRHVVWA